jgi:hypothetical protein
MALKNAAPQSKSEYDAVRPSHRKIHPGNAARASIGSEQMNAAPIAPTTAIPAKT